jgi:NitT/TauT family transport system substrate-binding protein
MMQSRRRFLAGASLAGAAGLVGAPRSFSAEPPPETTTVRLPKIPGICVAPQYIAEDLLRAEGFSDIRYVESSAGTVNSQKMADREIDFGMNFVGPLVVSIDAGQPITIVAGVHPGCFELFANQSIRSIADLKGKSVGVQGVGTKYLFLPGQHGHLRRSRPC